MDHTSLKTSTIHESGHLLAAILNGAVVHNVEVFSTGGLTRFMFKGVASDDNVSNDHFKSQQLILIHLSGPCASFKIQGFLKGHEIAEDVPDCMMVLRMKGWSLPYPNYSNMDFFLDYSGDAKRFVDHPIRWKMINTLAEMLMKKRRVSGQAAVKFFEDEVDKLPTSDQTELLFPSDGLGGDQLPWTKHKN